MRLLIVAFIGMVSAIPARADAPRVVVDIAPIHSLTAQVMDGVASPTLLIEPNASPHGYALKPSQARALASADLVIWVGEGLTPWLEGSLETLAGDAAVIEVIQMGGLTLLPIRDGEDHAGHDDHAKGSRDHGNTDPHLWLDTENAQVIAARLAETLASIDPANAEHYQANAAAAIDRIKALGEEATSTLAPIKDRPYVVFHDAYQYFEARTGLARAQAITLSDAVRPGARRIAEVREILRETNARCVFAEPQFPERTVETILRGSDARLAVLDPMGSKHAPGPLLYNALIADLAAGLLDCLR